MLRPGITDQTINFWITGGALFTGQAAAGKLSYDAIAYPSGTTYAGVGTWVEVDSVNLPGMYTLSLADLSSVVDTDRVLVVSVQSSDADIRWRESSKFLDLDPHWETTLLSGGFTPAQHSLYAFRVGMLDAMAPVVRDD